MCPTYHTFFCLDEQYHKCKTYFFLDVSSSIIRWRLPPEHIWVFTRTRGHLLGVVCYMRLSCTLR